MWSTCPSTARRNRILVDIAEIPDDLINATVAIEDETFWDHHGVNWKRTLYGVILMFTGGGHPGRLHHHPAADQKRHPV